MREEETRRLGIVLALISYVLGMGAGSAATTACTTQDRVQAATIVVDLADVECVRIAQRTKSGALEDVCVGLDALEQLLAKRRDGGSP